MNEEGLHEILYTMLGKQAAAAGLSDRDIHEGIEAFIDCVSEMIDLPSYAEENLDDVGSLLALFLNGISFGRATMVREQKERDACAYVNNDGMLH